MTKPGLLLAGDRKAGYARVVKRKPPRLQVQPRSQTMSAAEAAEFLDMPITTFYGLVDKGEIPRIAGDEQPFRYRFDTQAMIQIAAERADHPKPLARDGTHRGRPRTSPENEKVRQFGRATDEEVARWRKCAHAAGHGDNVWPWLRGLANAAADKAGV